MQILGLGHEARTGKDSVADYLVSKHGFVKCSFATAVKRACAAIFHLTPEQLDGELKDVIDPYWQKTPRELFQVFGTNVMRQHMGESIWVASLHRGMLLADLQYVVIQDVRFRNEADYILATGGLLVRCLCPDGPKIEKARASHRSETELADYPWPYTIAARFGELPRLYEAIEEILRKHKWIEG